MSLSVEIGTTTKASESKNANDPPEKGKEGTYDIKVEFNMGGDEERVKAGVPMDGVHRWTTYETLAAWGNFWGYSIICFLVYWWAIYCTYHVFLSQDRGYGYVDYFKDFKNVIDPPFESFMSRK